MPLPKERFKPLFPICSPAPVGCGMVWFSILALTSGFNIFQEVSQGAKSMSTVSNLSFLMFAVSVSRFEWVFSPDMIGSKKGNQKAHTSNQVTFSPNSVSTLRGSYGRC